MNSPLYFARATRPKSLAVILFAFICTVSANASDSLRIQISEIDSAFASGKFDEVELLTLRLLQSNPDIEENDLVHVHVTTGNALVMLNRESDARDYYRRALDANPDLTLNPTDVSPKFRVVFDDVKASYKRNDNIFSSEANELSTGPSRNSLLLNLFIPGAGQLNEKSYIKGTTFLVLQAASLGFFIYQSGVTRNSRENYLAQNDPVLIRQAYDDYNSDYSLAWIAAGATAAVYLAAQADLIFLKKRPARLTLLPSPTSNSLSAFLIFDF